MFEQTLFKRHLEEDEELILIVHKHWIVGLRDLFWPAVSFIVSLTFLYLAPVKVVLYIVLAWGGFSVTWLLRNFFDYYLDAWIVTNQGVIDLAWFGWFHRQSTRILYSDIQGVSYEIQGLLSTLFYFGKVNIEKVSTGSVISLENVPKPRDVEVLVLKNMETYMHAKNLKNAKHVQEILSTFIAEQIHLQNIPKKKSRPDEERSTEPEKDSAIDPTPKKKRRLSLKKP